MNEFEKARQKTLDRQRRQTLTLNKGQSVTEVPPPAPEPERVPFFGEIPAEVPKEEAPRKAVGVITVRVDLPDGEMQFTFIKDNVMQNVPKRLLARENLRRALEDGLRPVFGGVRSL